jgi:hypothetical protein
VQWCFHALEEGHNPGDPTHVAQRPAGRLVYDDVVSELGALETPADAKRWLRQIVLWGAAQRIALKLRATRPTTQAASRVC